MPNYTFGAKLSPVDYRDIPLSAVQAPVQLPLKYVTDISMLPVENQGQQPACVGHAIQKLLQYYDYKEKGVITPLSPRFIYAESKMSDGAPTMEGTNPRVAAKVTSDLGCTTTDLVPNDTSLSLADYINIGASTAYISNAYPYRTKGFAFVDLNINAIMQAIYQNGCVTASLEVGSYTDAPMHAGSIGIHHILVYGYEVVGTDTKLYFRNSWGEEWGEHGNGYILWSEFGGFFSTRIHDVIAYVDIPDELLQTVKTAYQYFKPDEKTGGGHTVSELQDSLMLKLDKARGWAGIPFIITSGKRTISENILVGGKSDSAHLSGEAADILCTNAINRWKMVNALLQAGFNRIEVAASHIHVDVSTTLPQYIFDFSSLA